MIQKSILWASFMYFFLFSCESLTSEQKAELDRGREVYLTHCVSCHGDKGDGMGGAYPTLIKPEILEAHTARSVTLIKQGSGFEAGMKPIDLTNQEIVEVVNYIQNTWGNKAPFLTEKQIQDIL
ncbi:cytochrome c [Rapidithrix thailandica]|uniref:Cytochrome c n=1 Tax=Rapidithrix thailandica TaxID=413964 RepID=A0AAW9SAP7_9BACT